MTIENRCRGAQISLDSVEDRFTKDLAKHHQAEVVIRVPLNPTKKLN